MDAFTLVRTDGASTTCRDGDCNNLVAARWCLRPAYALRTHVARGDPACPARAFAAPRPPNHALALAHSQDGLTKDGSTRASQSLRVARRCGPCLGPTLPRLLLGQRTAVGSSLHRHERAGAPRRAVLCHATKAPRHAHSQIVHPSPRRRFMDEIRRKHGAAWAPGALAPGGKLYAPSAGHTGVLEGRSRRKRECDYGVFMPRHVCLFSDDAMQARALVLVSAPMDTPACPSQSLVRPTCRTASLTRPLRRGRGRTSS